MVTQLVVEFLLSLCKILDLIPSLYIPGLVLCACNLSTQEAEAGGSGAQGCLSQFCLRPAYATWNSVPQNLTKIFIDLMKITDKTQIWDYVNRKGNLKAELIYNVEYLMLGLRIPYIWRILVA